MHDHLKLCPLGDFSLAIVLVLREEYTETQFGVLDNYQGVCWKRLWKKEKESKIGQRGGIA